MSGPRGWPVSGWFTALALLLRAGLHPRPPALDVQQRLAMLPLAGAPLSQPVRIRWNARQVPMVEADSDEDLMVALGVVHAHLRLGQIEVLRRLSQGRLSEMIGPLGLSVDQSLRALDLGRAVPAMLAQMPDQDRRLGESFVAGLNHGLLGAAGLPPEFALLGLRAEAWTLAEWLQFARLAAVDISWLVWQQLLPLRQQMDRGQWQALWPRLCQAGMPGSGVLDAREPMSRALSGLLRSGSNAVAVAAARTRGGGGLLASDPHLPLQLPSAWLLAGWRSPGFHCVGMMMPGLPFMLLGRNSWLAWGGTSLHAQSSDLYDVSHLPAEDFSHHRQEVRLRGGGRRWLQWRECALGPVVSEGALWSSRRPLALRWVGHQPSNELGAMLAVARARDVAGFRQALAPYAVSGANMVCCDRAGDVAHLLAARLPQRGSGVPPDLVLEPGDDAHWRGLLGSQQLPMRFNPPEGVVVSANQPPPQGGPPVGWFFAPADRAERWQHLLQAATLLDAGQLKMMQRDVTCPGSLALCQTWLAWIPRDRLGSRTRAVVDLLAHWDGRYAADSAAALAFELLQSRLAYGLRRRAQMRAYQAVWMQRRLLAEDMAALAPDQRLQQLLQALPWVARRLRRHRSWGQAHRLQPRHPLAWLPGWAHCVEPESMAGEGGQTTICKSGHGLVRGRHRASFGSCARQVCDLADPDANDFVLLGGQDGWPGSDTCLDQLALWRRGDYIRLPLTAAAVAQGYPHLTVLLPAP
ncbi:penicillin acylase family protein [Frateuria aurantia]|uniref:Penicilin amidase n=1 Tax=Frateuria aurantia (strain ATCC 33424 / DSM 6220 / KCTC 2777 / LMG 1558 / NBRC 3245 / NCIMB 13370) TaxID=767434 RepID=H8L331_FRAAD|nr:penicillin acylase family protein [Frateuria aurantia]AFC84829.1 penicilin amidase [Frateuria aurantia DSM 6220]